MQKIILATFLFLSSLSVFANSEVLPVYEANKIDYTLQVDEDVEIYPNPAHSNATIKVEGTNKIKQIAIYSLLGNAIYQKTFDKVSYVDLNVQSFKKGKYIIKVTLSDNTSTVKTLIKQ